MRPTRSLDARRAPAALAAVLALVATLLASTPAGADHATRRWSGGDRIATAVEVSRRTFTRTVATVVLANKDAFADALAAGPLAGALGAPVLLVERDRLTAPVEAELDRLDPDEVLLLGGPGVLTDAVLAAADARANDRARRVSGPNRYATAAEAARLAVAAWRADGDGAAGRRVVVALGNHGDPSRAWPDALAAGVDAGLRHEPLLLVEPGRAPVETRDAIADLGATSAIVVGGRGAIPDATADQLGVPWTRVSGASRYATGAALAERAVAAGADPSEVTVVTGRNFADALGAVPSVLHRGGVLLLVDGLDLDRSPAARAWLEGRRGAVTTLTAIGGPRVVTEAVLDQVEVALDGPKEVVLRLEEVVDASTALAVRSDPAEPDVLYVAERAGRVLRVDDGGATPRTSTFLDIRSEVGTGGERGLLDLVLHPDFATNGRLFVHHSGRDGRTVLAEYRRSTSDPTVAGGRGTTLFETSQPASNHNGGGLAFLPDGTLLLALGDGGGANDQYRTGQDAGSPLASLLRFDVSTPGRASVPPDNPWVGRSGRDELWAKGLRNPYRISLDAPSGTLYVADVGQDRHEEVNAVAWDAAGLDYGWSTMEGPDCFLVPSCDRSGLTLPVHSYPHEGSVCSITGGHVHRGSIAAMRGHYFFGDFCSGQVWSFLLADGRPTQLREWPSLSAGNVYSFGLDARGEVYVLTSGTVYRIVEG